MLFLALVIASCGQQTTTGGTGQPAATSSGVPAVTDVAQAVPETAEATQPAPATAVAATTPTAPSPTPTAAPTAEPTPGPGQFVNPVVENDFPDPGALKVGDTYYVYATNSGSTNVQLASSKDLVHWQSLMDPLPDLPPWASTGYTWAPEAIQLADGKTFAIYFTARDTASQKQCVGVATGASPAGPFKSSAPKPLVCQVELGGTIDPSPFRDGDKLYLLFKNDGNCCGMDTNLYAQELTPDGLTLTGQPAKLETNDQFWEGRVVEAPEMVKHDGKYYLFYSGNNYAGADYAVGYTLCTSVAGPCQDAPENPILKTVSDPKPVIGPGHQSITTFGDTTWILYHAWEVAPGVGITQRRLMYIDRVEWKDGKPVVRGPTTSPQPMP